MAESKGEHFSSVPHSRRAFLKKMAAVAFVTPIVSSFGLDSLAAAPLHHPLIHFPNQHEDQDRDRDDRPKAPDPDDPRHHQPHQP
jgi:hypothetical protein